ncbi:hypothetical protein D9M68_952680 [compost metagenome]
MVETLTGNGCAVGSTGHLGRHRATQLDVHGVSHLVKNLGALAASRQHAGLVHQAEMTGHIGLRQRGHLDDLVDTLLLLAKRVQDAQPRRLAEHAEIARHGLKNLVHVIHRLVSRLV